MSSDANAMQCQLGNLEQFLYESMARRLITDLFSIIVDYPTSAPAIRDLAICLDRTNLRAELISTVRQDVIRRLLHIG